MQLEQRGYPQPTVDFIRKKSKRIEQAKTFQFKEEDIDKVCIYTHTAHACAHIQYIVGPLVHYVVVHICFVA